MKALLTASACAFLLVAGVASANAADATSTQNTTATQNATPPKYADPVIADANAMKSADEMQHTSIRQQLQSQLEKAGYTSVKITPSSFFVEAKNKKGEPVAMVVGPDSFASVTEMPMKQQQGAAAQPSPESTPAQK